jgi:hypothetical protein
MFILILLLTLAVLLLIINNIIFNFRNRLYQIYLSIIPSILLIFLYFFYTIVKFIIKFKNNILKLFQ